MQYFQDPMMIFDDKSCGTGLSKDKKRGIQSFILRLKTFFCTLKTIRHHSRHVFQRNDLCQSRHFSVTFSRLFCRTSVLLLSHTSIFRRLPMVSLLHQSYLQMTHRNRSVRYFLLLDRYSLVHSTNKDNGQVRFIL